MSKRNMRTLKFFDYYSEFIVCRGVLVLGFLGMIFIGLRNELWWRFL